MPWEGFRTKIKHHLFQKLVSYWHLFFLIVLLVAKKSRKSAIKTPFSSDEDHHVSVRKNVSSHQMLWVVKLSESNEISSSPFSYLQGRGGELLFKGKGIGEPISLIVTNIIPPPPLATFPRSAPDPALLVMNHS